MADRTKFLAGVTASLGRTEILTPSADNATAGFDDHATAKTNAEIAMNDASVRSVELADQMAVAAATAGWKVHRVANLGGILRGYR